MGKSINVEASDIHSRSIRSMANWKYRVIAKRLFKFFETNFFDCAIRPLDEIVGSQSVFLIAMFYSSRHARR